MSSTNHSPVVSVNHNDPEILRLRKARALADRVWCSADNLWEQLHETLEDIDRSLHVVDKEAAGENLHAIATSFHQSCLLALDGAEATRRDAHAWFLALDRIVVERGELSTWDAPDAQHLWSESQQATSDEWREKILELDAHVELDDPDVQTEDLPCGWTAVVVPPSRLRSWLGSPSLETSSATRRVYVDNTRNALERRARALGALGDLALNTGDAELITAVDAAEAEVSG